MVTALSDTAWDTPAVLSDTSLFGRVIHTLIGYSDRPSVRLEARLLCIPALGKSFYLENPLLLEEGCSSNGYQHRLAR